MALDTTTKAANRTTRRPLGRRFWRIWSANGVSKIGDGMLVVALPLYAAKVSHGSPLAVALVAFASRLPWLLIALPAGALADRRPHRTTMVASDLARFVVVASVAVAVATHHAGIPVLFAAAFLVGAFDTLFNAAAVNALPACVDHDDLGRANGLMMAADAGTEQVGGPTTAGILYSIAAVVPFVADAISFLVSAAVLRRLPRNPVGNPAATTLRSDMREGWASFRTNRIVVSITALVASAAFCQMVMDAVLVVFVTTQLGLDSTGFGLFVAASSTTNVLGFLVADRVWRRLGTTSTITISLAAMAGGYLVLASASSTIVAALAIAVQAFVVPWTMVASSTLRMQSTEAATRGKVMNVSRTIVIGSAAAGALAGGLLGSMFGVRAAIATAGVVVGTVCLLSVRPLRAVVRLVDARRRTDEAASQIDDDDDDDDDERAGGHGATGDDNRVTGLPEAQRSPLPPPVVTWGPPLPAPAPVAALTGVGVQG